MLEKTDWEKCLAGIYLIYPSHHDKMPRLSEEDDQEETREAFEEPRGVLLREGSGILSVGQTSTGGVQEDF